MTTDAKFEKARGSLLVLFAWGIILSIATAGSAQNSPTIPAPANSGSPSARQPTGQAGDDITRRDVVDMSHFLNSHREIAEQLRKDPSLIDNNKWIAAHPELQSYLREHPQVAEEFRSDPNQFMHDEDRFDRDDITRRDVVDMNHFLDSHPEVAEQLRKDPSLIDNNKWVAAHPELQEYLREHPQVADAFRSNPNQFMRDEDRLDRDDITRQDLADMNHFLDSHPEIAEQLRKDPSLVDNNKWVAAHPALQDYLQKHPQVADAFRSNPNGFMQDEWRYEHQEAENRYPVDNGNRDNDRNRGELTNFGHFLGGHSSLAADLQRDPSLANSQEYRSSHPELDEYLKAHPDMNQQLAANPQAVMTSNWVQQNGATMGTSSKPEVPATPKTKANPNQ